MGGHRRPDARTPAPATRKMLQLTKKNLCSAACVMGLALSLCAGSAVAQASSSSPDPQSTAAPGTAAAKTGTVIAPTVYTGPSYDNRWEIYGGLLFMNGQAGQNLPKRYNMGGGEGMGVYWLGQPRSKSFVKRHFGLAADYRFGAGTTPVLSEYYNRVLVYQSIVSGGFQYRWVKNRYVALDLHGLAGATHGTFDHAVNNYPGGSPVSSCPNNTKPGQQGNIGLYCNSTAPWGAAGGSIDFNESPRLTIRLSPDMTFEHFGTETHEYFSVSMGVMYRLGKNK